MLVAGAGRHTDGMRTQPPVTVPPGRIRRVRVRRSITAAAGRLRTGIVWRFTVPTVVTVLLVTAGMFGAAPYLLIAAAVVVPFELLFPRDRDQGLLRPEVGTDIAHGAATTILSLVGGFVATVVGFATLGWLPGRFLEPFVAALPGWALVVVGFLLFDLATYWAHRWHHEVPFLWRFHAIHHSIERLDWAATFRNHPFEFVFVVFPYTLLTSAGFPGELTGALLFAQIGWGFFFHANVSWSLRPLHKIVSTPDFHHWHHALDDAAIDKNFANFLPIWDVLFGSYYLPADRRPVGYGVHQEVPRGLYRQLLYPFRGMPTPWALARTGVRRPVTSLGWLAAWTWDFTRSIARSTGSGFASLRRLGRAQTAPEGWSRRT